MTLKTCSACGVSKPLDAFPKRSNIASGREAKCKDCYNAVRRGRYKSRSAGTVEGVWLLVRDPSQMYVSDSRWLSQDFLGTLADGYWPDGCIWQGVVGDDEHPARWVVKGSELHEEGGPRVLVAFQFRGQTKVRIEEHGSH